MPKSERCPLSRDLLDRTRRVGATHKAELRDEYPGGWRVLTQHDSVSYMIDALMHAPDYQFSKSKLAEQAGVSRQSVHRHLPLLRKLDIVRVVEGSSPETYTLNTDEDVVKLRPHTGRPPRRPRTPRAPCS